MVEWIFLAIGGALFGSFSVALRIRTSLLARYVLARLQKVSDIYAEKLITRLVLKDGYILTFVVFQILGKWISLIGATTIGAGYLSHSLEKAVFILSSLLNLVTWERKGADCIYASAPFSFLFPKFISNLRNYLTFHWLVWICLIVVSTLFIFWLIFFVKLISIFCQSFI